MNINIEQQLKVILGKSLDEASKEEIYIALLNFTKKQLQQMTSKKGFIAALDQSGGSTPKALRLYFC